MGHSNKIHSLEALKSAVAAERAGGRRIVHCHGVFDLVHIGHIRHLERARRMGDVLVVTVTPDRYVNKGPHRPAFPEQLRAEAVAALHCVDLVAINQWPTAVEAIRLLRPDVYVKGAEYRDADKDVTGGINLERQAIESAGGEIAFTDDVTFSSSGLLNRHLPVLSDEARAFLGDFRKRYRLEDVLGYFEKARDLKVLVVGETIIDEYQYCQAIGKSSKAPALVAKLENHERFGGGVLAVANHVASVCDGVTVITQLGMLNSHEAFVREQLVQSVKPVFVRRKDAPTIVKRRFIESYFFTNMFELYEINDNAPQADDNAALCAALHEHVPRHDLVLVVDYGHGMLTDQAIDILCHEARFLAMNAQANAGNHGYHRISKYPRADYVCAAEHEMFMEARDWRGDLHPVVLDVARRLACARVIVTCGKRGALCYGGDTTFLDIPALATRVVDRVGAGDAFLAISAPYAALEAPIELVGFVGNVAGAEAVSIVGHRRYLRRDGLVKHLQTLLA
jgi:rfaE bifunctional protein nucleotidyltransferase chain/domain